MYGSGKFEVAPAPPVPQLCASYAINLPSAVTPALMCAIADGRLPVARCSSFRSSISLTGTFACCASFAQINPCVSGPNLLPKPPPMYCVITRTLVCGICSPCANPCAVPCAACVDTHAVSLSPSHSQTQPCVSRHTCVTTCVEYVASTTCAACLKPASMSPDSCTGPGFVLPPVNTTGASAAIARSTNARCG